MINSVKCLQCGEVLTSTYRHDFQMCHCENQTFCDGGSDYSRIGGADFKKIAIYDNNLQKYVPMEDKTNG